jgi:hypothetical protein
MAMRGDRQMPPLGTNVVDEVGVQVIRQWIDDISGSERRATGSRK